MAEFQILRNVSKNFEKKIRELSNELFSANIDESFEDIVAKKTRDLALFNSKLRLLHAVPIAETPQVMEVNKNEHTTINDYTDTVDWKIIEQQTVKILTQTHTVKNLFASSNRRLDPVLVEKKENLIEQLTKYRAKEAQLRQLEALLQEKEDQLLLSRQAWDETLWNFKDSPKIPQTDEVATGRMYNYLQVLVKKMELMRWMLSKIVMSRTVRYDWMTDPHNRLNALALARQRHTVHDYTEGP